MSDRQRGVRDGMESSEGDPRVVFLLGVVLSAGFAWTVVWGLDLLGAVAFSLGNVAAVALVLFALTYLVAMR
ncbi:hypothetical protein BRD22_12130 [Halobacteriales archaeon SW_8_68_21]|nr:MAG: hypothetical protein BRD22_12130 [Halobacteriales archaeon SW_8_68_21]